MSKRTMYEIGIANKTDKVHHHRYDRYYPTFLEKFRDKEIVMCEIGVHNCASVNMWAEYFPKAKIFGVDNDINASCDKAKIIHADQSIAEDVQKIIDQIGKCDFIIDDGSHHPQHQYDTFTQLFYKSLNYSGVYIIEDIECHYWRDDTSTYGHKLGQRRAVFEFFERSYDLVNEEFSRVNNYLDIATVTYAQNCVIITKRSEDELDICKRGYRFGSNR